MSRYKASISILRRLSVHVNHMYVLVRTGEKVGGGRYSSCNRDHQSTHTTTALTPGVTWSPGRCTIAFAAPWLPTPAGLELAHK